MIQAFQRLSLTSTQYYTQISSSQLSEELQRSSPFKRLDSVIIKDFKSFKGAVFIGPLLDFTSIVGPNGAGKSNVLDALMFCFCNEKNKLNFFDIRQFITREGNQTYKDMMKRGKYCEVEAKFILQNDRTLTLSRRLCPSEEQVFKINGEQYPQKTYENFLMKNNINFITSNYAIWQGEIDKVLLKSPKDLTNYIQTVSGSTFFRKEQEELRNEIKGIEAHTQKRTLKLSKLRQAKKHLKNLTNHKNQTLQIQNQYEQLLKQIVLVKSYISEMELKAFEKEINAQEKEEKRKCKEINENKAQLQKQQIQKGKLENEITVLLKSISENYAKLKNAQHLNNIIDIQTVSELSQEVESLKKYYDHIRTRKGDLEHQLNQLASNDSNKEYLELYSRWSSENEAINKEFKKRKEEYLYTEGILQSKRNIMEEFNQKQLKIEELAKDQLRQKHDLETHIYDISNTISKMNVQSANITQEFDQNRSKVQGLQTKILEKNQKIIDLETLLSDSMEDQKDKQILVKLFQIEGFKGLVSDWVKPSNKKYEVCFQMMMGPIIKHLLCIDEACSKQITIKLRQNYQIRNLVILNNVHQKKELVTRATLGKFGFLAMEAIDLDKKLNHFDLFLKDFLNGKVICDNLGAAWKLLEQNVRGIREIFTLDGNVLRHDGVVSSHGSVQFSKNKYKYIDIARNSHTVMEDIQALSKQKDKLEETLSALKKKCNDEAMLKHTLEIQRLETKKTELSLKLDYLKKSIQNRKEGKSHKGLQKQIQELENRVKALYSGVEEIEKQMLKSKIFSDFIKKNNISGLGNFRSVQDLSSLEQNMKQRLKMGKDIQQIEREIVRTFSQISQKEEKLTRLNEKVNSIKGFEEKENIKKNLKRQEEQLTSFRNQLSKIKNVNLESLKFKSEIPQMTSKLEVMNERHKKLVKEEAQHYGLAEVPDLDYNFLEERAGIKLERATLERVEGVADELEKEKVELETDMEKNNIGLTDLKSEYSDEKELDREIQQLTDQLKEANSNKTELFEKLDRVKEDRKALFMNFMNELKPTLQFAYETLTQRENSSGRVDIYMENQRFPCDEGLYYTPIPPSKRFVYDLDQLSGGEKSIASLALQYAIAITSKSPFIVLDETDAFLDAENTKRFIHLIQKTLSDKKLQFIIITHKKGLFSEGESLVGLTKFKNDPFSKAFSLRLNEPEEQLGVTHD